jgi:hypothetical protein
VIRLPSALRNTDSSTTRNERGRRVMVGKCRASAGSDQKLAFLLLLPGKDSGLRHSAKLGMIYSGEFDG